MRRSRRILLSLSLLAGAGSAGAQDVTVGGPADHTNSYPFTVYQFQLPNRYQQMYTASSFSQALTRLTRSSRTPAQLLHAAVNALAVAMAKAGVGRN